MNEKVGVIYFVGLKVILCYDLDMIILGEIRDVEIVKIVVWVVMMGYLVLMSFYMRDVKGVIYRLFEFGINMNEIE